MTSTELYNADPVERNPATSPPVTPRDLHDTRCSWCGHSHHDSPCVRLLNEHKPNPQPCPCRSHERTFS